MKKIAICLSGELRYFNHELVINGFNQFINSLNPDIFISTWSHIGFSMNHGWIDPLEKKNNIEYSELERDITYAYKNVKKIHIENYNQWFGSIDEEIKKNVYNNPNIWDKRTINSYSQLYKIYQANQLKIKYEKENNFKYDIVLRVRPDSLFVREIDINIEPKTIYNINFMKDLPNRIYDIFFYGDNDSMDKLCDTYLNVVNLIENSFNNGLCKRDACRLLFLQALNNQISVKSTKDIPCDIWRNNVSFQEYYNSLQF